MTKRRRQRKTQNFKDWYFNLSPTSGSRNIKGYFVPKNIENSNLFINRFANTAPANTPLNDYTKCYIDVDPSSTRGFIIDSTSDDFDDIEEPDNDYRLMLKCVSFSANNSPMNISDRLGNTKFWVWDDWVQDDYTFKPTSSLWSQTFKEYKLDNGFYPDQTSLINGMKEKTSSVVDFSFDNGTQLLTYTGTKPLLLQVSHKFDPKYYKDRPNVIIVDDVNSVPANMSGIKISGSAANFFAVKTVNSKPISIKILDPEYYLDLLVVKLGFGFSTTDTKDKICTYFGYPTVMRFGNTSSGTDAETYLDNNDGTICILLYPLAKGNTFGNMYGSMAHINITSPDIDSVIPGENVIATVPVASWPAQTTNEYVGNQWFPLTNSTGLNKHFEFELADDYGRPYELNVGPPEIECAVELRSST